MKKIIYTINALFAIFALVYLLPAIKVISFTEMINSGIFGFALIAEILVAIAVIFTAIMLLIKKINPSQTLDLFSILFLFFGLLNMIPRLMRMSYYVNDLLCKGAVSSVCTGNGIVAWLSHASNSFTIYIQFIFFVFVIFGLYTTFKKKTV
jgi:hypothetical protein